MATAKMTTIGVPSRLETVSLSFSTAVEASVSVSLFVISSMTGVSGRASLSGFSTGAEGCTSGVSVSGCPVSVSGVADT